MHIHALRCFGFHPGDADSALVIEDDALSGQAIDLPQDGLDTLYTRVAGDIVSVGSRVELL